MATARTMDEIIADIEKKFDISTVTEQQRESIMALRNAKDIFISTRTGSGKSLSYECVPLVFKDACALIIAPLTSIMTEQCTKLNSLGFKATYIGRDTEEDQRIAEADFDFIFSSPENVVGNPKWRGIVSTPTFAAKLKLIVVDEAHTVLQWGEGKDEEDPFREWFSKIGELRSLFLDVPMMAMTATASPLSRKRIMRQLNFKPTREVVLDSSDRRNIKITSHAVSLSAPIIDTFGWLFKELQDKKETLPRHLIFCSSINDCAKIYASFVAHFGRGFIHVNMYHSKTNEAVKQAIREDMNKESGSIRVLICTNAAGMGVNFKMVNNVVHFGLPREMDTFIQQMGRAGRDGSFAHELILLKLSKNHLKKTEPDLIRFARDKDVCRHKHLCNSYLCKHVPIEPKHNCCDVCEAKCDCGEEECPRKHPIHNQEQDLDLSLEEFSREVSESDKDLLRQQLVNLQLSLAADTKFDTLVDTSVYGVSSSLIDETVNKCSMLFTPVDVMTHTTCWSYNVASLISDIITEVFGDKDMYDLEESDELSEDSDH